MVLVPVVLAMPTLKQYNEQTVALKTQQEEAVTLLLLWVAALPTSCPIPTQVGKAHPDFRSHRVWLAMAEHTRWFRSWHMFLMTEAAV